METFFKMLRYMLGFNTHPTSIIYALLSFQGIDHFLESLEEITIL